MKVKTLIKKLENLNQNARVITYGYEGGYCDVIEIKEKEIVLNVNKESYYGPHEDSNYYSVKNKKLKRYKAYLL